MSKVNVFFGILEGDLFLGEEHMPEGTVIDYDASVMKYAKMCTKAIKKAFKKHGQKATVEWESQNAGGAIPWGLQTRVDEDTEHDDVEWVDSIVGEVWQEWKWCVTK